MNLPVTTCSILEGKEREECELYKEAMRTEQKGKEWHLPGYNYCGPGTKVVTRLVRGDKGINNLDEGCKGEYSI